MKIDLQNTGKRFNREWIFRKFNYTFEPGKKYAITGPNGSGKSTLLQVIAGAILHSEGDVFYTDTNGNAVTHPYKQLAIATPYLELIEEMTAQEMLLFHQKFKPLSDTPEAVLNACGLSENAHKQIRYFSSGMKQRIKLGMTFFSDVPVLLLDEPTTNLDTDGIAIYNKLLQNNSRNRTLFIGSNVATEYASCDTIISITDYKP